MDQQQMKQAREQIEAVVKQHDLAAFVTLHGAGWGEVFWNLQPSMSILSGDFPNIRIRSRLQEDHGGDAKRQHACQEYTTQMAHHFATVLDGCAPQFVHLSKSLDKVFDAQHNDKELPDNPADAGALLVTAEARVDMTLTLDWAITHLQGLGLPESDVNHTLHRLKEMRRKLAGEGGSNAQSS